MKMLVKSMVMSLTILTANMVQADVRLDDNESDIQAESIPTPRIIWQGHKFIVVGSEKIVFMGYGEKVVYSSAASFDYYKDAPRPFFRFLTCRDISGETIICQVHPNDALICN